ncbi:hypothetical protein NDI45_21985 [Leptolyngbya sp. GB1-A1]|uniref:hypothetical protein n=1 Tax=Leptolyngbya sp. GB1-A1 TaxID=2933908 RepID=UPI003297A98E
MNLPFIVDVAIGLVLIYLILSLLSSEIQEILATILQWRAAHLKKSIEILLMGDGSVQGDYLKLANQGIFQTPAEVAQHTVSFLPDSDPNKPAIQDLIQSQLETLRGTAEEQTAAIVQALDSKGLVSGDGVTETGSTIPIKSEISRRLRDALLIEELYRAKAVTQKIYNDPLIRNISQDAREGFEGLIRGVTRSVVTVGRSNTTLDRGNEPSYIPSETFATTLLEILNIPQFTRRLTALNLQILVQDQIISDIEDAVKRYQSQGKSQELNRFIDAGFNKFSDKLHLVLKAFVDQRLSLEMTISLIRGELVEYVNNAQAIRKKLAASQDTNRARSIAPEDLEVFDAFANQLVSIRQLVFYEDPQGEYHNTNELIQQLQPSVAQVMKAFRSDLQDIDQKYRRFTDSESLRSNPNLSGYQEIIALYNEIHRDAQQIAQTLPFSVRVSLNALADRAQINPTQAKGEVRRAQDDLYQFKTEVEKWFDRSMERASGVYKRNAKGVGFLIGLTIALAANADTIHIAQRLASSTTLRQALVSSAEIVTQSCPRPISPTNPEAAPATNPEPVPAPEVAPPVIPPAPEAAPVAPPAEPAPVSRLFFEQPAYAQAQAVPSAPEASSASTNSSVNCIEQAVGDVTQLPLGWGEENQSQQMAIKPIDSNGDGKPEEPAPWMPLWNQLKRAIGWIVSGLAISMGAAFWFEFLSKLVNVRNTGKRPDDRPAT